MEAQEAMDTTTLKPSTMTAILPRQARITLGVSQPVVISTSKATMRWVATAQQVWLYNEVTIASDF